MRYKKLSDCQVDATAVGGFTIDKLMKQIELPTTPGSTIDANTLTQPMTNYVLLTDTNLANITLVNFPTWYGGGFNLICLEQGAGRYKHQYLSPYGANCFLYERAIHIANSQAVWGEWKKFEPV